MIATEKLYHALSRLMAQNDNEFGCIDTKPWPSCNICTDGCTPMKHDHGVCPYHEAQAAIVAYEDENPDVK